MASPMYASTTNAQLRLSKLRCDRGTETCFADHYGGAARQDRPWATVLRLVSLGARTTMRKKRSAQPVDHLQQPPDCPEIALLLIDVINDLEFEGGENLLTSALPMAAALAALKCRAKALGIPVIYANDNFGRWRSDFQKLVQRSLRVGIRGRPVVTLLQPSQASGLSSSFKRSKRWQPLKLNSNPSLSPFFKGGIFSVRLSPLFAKEGKGRFSDGMTRELCRELLRQDTRASRFMRRSSVRLARL